MLTSWIASGLMALACCGYGLWLLDFLRYPARPTLERVGIAFALGTGMLGWLVFFLGLSGGLDRAGFALLLLPGLLAIVRHRPPRPRLLGISDLGWVSIFLLAGLAVSVGIDLLESLAPPADVDTLAYHFAIPRRFLAEGRISFVPIAVEGAVPLLIHMTYTAALGLGGEAGVQAWALLTELGLITTFYALARRYLPRSWSLALALILITTPAVIYTGGAGHVETRTAWFMLVAAIAGIDGIRERHSGALVAAGLAAGFFMGSKYYGLFAAAALGLVLLWQRRPFRPVLIYGLAALLAGSQWYVWNWIHSGDPLFPALSLELGQAGALWNPEIDDFFSAAYRRWIGVPASPKWFLLYPFAALLAPEPAFEAGRTGLGPIVLLAIPWALAGIYSRRRSIDTSLYRLLAIAVAFYALWFFIPTNQLTRQLLPVFPLILVAAAVIAARWSQGSRLMRPWIGAVLASIGLGLAVHALYSVNYLRYHLGGESRSAFLERNVSFSHVAAWTNAHLPPDARVGNPIRTINYLLDVPYLYLSPPYQAVVELHPQAKDVARFASQLRREQITHLLVWPSLSAPVRPSFGINYLSRSLVSAGCASVAQSIRTRNISSRTMGTGELTMADVVVLRLDRPGCRQNLGEDRTGPPPSRPVSGLRPEPPETGSGGDRLDAGRAAGGGLEP